MLVCIYKEYSPGPFRWDREATVVQMITGDWKIGDKSHFYIALEEPKLPARCPSAIGRLKYLFFDAYSKAPVLLQTGDSEYYQPEINSLVQKLPNR